MQQYDLQEIARQIKNTLHHHDSKDLFAYFINEDHIVSMLRRWQRNKAKIVDNLLDGELQIKIPIDQTKFRFGQANDQICDFLNKRAVDDRKKDKQRIYRQFLMVTGADLEHIFDNRKLNPRKHTQAWFLNTFVDWKYSILEHNYSECRNKMLEASDNCKSPKLTKQIKAIMETFKYTPKEIEDTLSVFSEIQSFNFELEKADYLILSVHPLDFITQSINDYGWSSCVNPNKEHFPSTFSTMQDAATMVCYLEGQKSKLVLYEEGVDTIYWNNKKIRALMCADHNLDNIFINQTYPNKQMNDFNKIIADFFAIKGYRLTETVSSTWCSGEDHEDIFPFVIDGSPHFYLDSPSGKCLLTKFDRPVPIMFDIGLDTLCLYCGENLGDHGTQIGCLCEECGSNVLGEDFESAYEFIEDADQDDCPQNYDQCQWQECDKCPYFKEKDDLFV